MFQHFGFLKDQQNQLSHSFSDGPGLASCPTKRGFSAGGRVMSNHCIYAFIDTEGTFVFGKLGTSFQSFLLKLTLDYQLKMSSIECNTYVSSYLLSCLFFLSFLCFHDIYHIWNKTNKKPISLPSLSLTLEFQITNVSLIKDYAHSKFLVHFKIIWNFLKHTPFPEVLVRFDKSFFTSNL